MKSIEEIKGSIINDIDMFFYSPIKEISLICLNLRIITCDEQYPSTITSEFWFRLQLMKILDAREKMEEIADWMPSRGYTRDIRDKSKSRTSDLWFKIRDSKGSEKEIIVEIKTGGRGLLIKHYWRLILDILTN